MTNTVTQQQLDHALRLFERLDKGEIEFEVLKDAVNNHAGLILSEQHLINCTFTQFVTGKFIVRRTGSLALTPAGQRRLAEIREE